MGAFPGRAVRVTAGDLKTLPPVRLQHFVSLIHFNGKKLKGPQ